MQRGSVVAVFAALWSVSCVHAGSPGRSSCPDVLRGAGGPLVATTCLPHDGRGWFGAGELRADDAGLLLMGASYGPLGERSIAPKPRGVHVLALASDGQRRWLGKVSNEHRESMPPVAYGPTAVHLLDGNGLTVELRSFSRVTGAPIGAYPLSFVTRGSVTDAVESSGGLHVAVSHALPTGQHDRYVARIDGSGQLVWRSPPLAHAGHVVVDPRGVTLAAQLGQNGWTMSLVDGRGGLLARRNIPSEARAKTYEYGRGVGRAAARVGGWLLVGRVGDDALELVVLSELGDVVAIRRFPAPPDCWGLSVPEGGCTTDYAVDPSGAVIVVGRTSARGGFVNLFGPTGGWTHRFGEVAPRHYASVWPYRVAVDGRGGAVVAGGLEAVGSDEPTPRNFIFVARFQLAP